MRRSILSTAMSALLLLSLFTAIYLLTVPPVRATTIFESDFEGPDTEWTGVGTSGSGTANLNKTTHPHAGSEHAQFNFTTGSTSSCYAYKTFAQSYTNLTFTTYASFNTTAEWRHVMRIVNNTGSWIFSVQMSYGTWRFWYCDGTSTSQQDVAHAISTNTYYNLTMQIFIDNYYGFYKFWIDGASVLSLTSLDTNLKGNAWGIHVGHTSGYAYNSQTMDYDDVKVTVPIAGDNPPTWGTPSHNTTIGNQPCNFSVTVSDDNGLSFFIGSCNNTGVWANETAVALSGTSDLASFAKTLNASATVVQYRFYANDSADQWSASVLKTLTVGDNPPTWVNVNTNSSQPNTVCNFTASLTDDAGLSHALWGSNNTGVWANGTWQSLTGTSDLATATTTLNSTQGVIVKWIIWFNDTANQWANTGYRYLTVGGANDFYADNGTALAIQAAVDAAEASGLIPANVHIPAGTWNFTEIGAWGGYTTKVVVPAGINIFGATTYKTSITVNGETQYMTDMPEEWFTILRMSYDVPSDVASERFPVWFHFAGTSNASEPSRFSDIALIGWRYYVHTSIYQSRGITTHGIINMRVDHVWMQDICAGNWMGATANQNFLGLIDHCIFINTHVDGVHYPEPYSSRTNGYGWGISAGGTTTWETDISKVQGTYDWMTVIIENCYFERWRHCICGGHGAHWVLRYSIVKNDYGFGSVDNHGVYTYVGARALEMYNVSFLYPDWTGHGVSFHRGGAGIYTNVTVRNYGASPCDGYYYCLAQLACEGAVEYCWPHDVYIWGNDLAGMLRVSCSVGTRTLDVDYFYRAPTVSQDGWEWEPYPYPHPLIAEQEALADNTVVLNVPTGILRKTNTVLFNYTVSMTTTIVNASLMLNISGGWVAAAWNTTVITENVFNYISFNFLSNGSGTYLWNVRVYNSSAYITAAANRTLIVSLEPSFGTPSASSLVAGSSCTISVSTGDGDGLSHFIAGSNNTGAFTNQTWTVITGTLNSSTYTITLNGTVGAKIQYQFWANDTDNQWVTTGLLTITTTSSTMYYFYFTFVDLNNNVIDNRVTFYVYNGSTQLNYIEGTATLLSGTYNITTVFNGYFIYNNASSISTATYGNTPFVVQVYMKLYTPFPASVWWGRWWDSWC